MTTIEKWPLVWKGIFLDIFDWTMTTSRVAVAFDDSYKKRSLVWKGRFVFLERFYYDD